MVWFKTENKPIVFFKDNKEYKIDVFQDDTILAVKKKILAQSKGYIKSINEIYLWSSIDLNKKNMEFYIMAFIENLFRKRTFITIREYQKSVKNVFEIDIKNEKKDIISALYVKNDLFTVLSNENKPALYMPIGHTFKTMDDFDNYSWPIVPSHQNQSSLNAKKLVDESSKILVDFDVSNINIYFGKDNPDYFPFRDESVFLTKQYASTCIDEIKLYKNSMELKPTYIQLKSIISKIDLFTLFNSSIVSKTIPFIKYQYEGKAHYKIFKEKSILLEDKKTFNEWVKPKSFINKDKLIIFRLLLSMDRYCTVIVFSNHISIQLPFRTFSDSTFEVYEKDFRHILKCLKDHKIDINYHQFKITDSVFKINLYNQFVKKINFAHIQEIFETHKCLSPFMTIMRIDSNQMIIKYKRKSFFYNDTNLNNVLYMLKKSEQKPDVLKTILSNMFEMSVEHATQFLNTWSDINKDYILKNNNDLVIKITKNSSGFKIDVKGIVNKIQEESISKGIQYIFDFSQKISKKNKTTELKVFNLEKTASDDDDDYEKEDDDDFFEEEQNDDINLDLELLKSQKCPIQRGGTGDTLNVLKNADMDFFNEKLYASRCQNQSLQQPVVMSNKDVEYNKRCFPSAIAGNIMKVGSSKEKIEENNYTCPSIWCPISKVALSFADFNALGRKCPFEPQIQEEPIDFTDSSYWAKSKSNNNGDIIRNIGFCKDKWPCCYVKKEKNDTSKNYIKGYSFPTEENRYSILPPSLQSIINKTCDYGNKGGNRKTNIDCFLKIGIPQTNQQFLQALGIDVDFIKNISIIDYVFLNNGETCRYFIDRINRSSIQSIENVQSFKQWFKSEKSGYKELFNLKHLDKKISLWKSDEHDPDKTWFSSELIREFYIYSSFLYFKSCTRDPNFVKTPELYLDLILKKEKKNILIIELDINEQAFIDTKYLAKFDKSKETIILLKKGNMYEPIHKLKNKDMITSFPYNLISDFVDYLIKKDRVLLPKEENIKYIIINYQHEVCGIYTQENVFIPYRNIEFREYDGLQYKYIDHMISDHDENFTPKEIQKIKNKLCLVLKIDEDKIKKEECFLKIENLYVPIKKSTLLPKIIIDDIDIFIGIKRSDSRILFVQEQNDINDLYDTFSNHIYNLIDKDDIAFIQHTNNPLPKTIKRLFVKQIIKDKKHFFYSPETTTSKKMKYNDLCFNKEEAELCNAPCKWTWIKKENKSSCKLEVEAKLIDIFINKIVEDIINNKNMDEFKNKKLIQLQDTILLTESNIEEYFFKHS